MRPALLSLLVAAGAGLPMPGCATIYEGRFNYDEGWRVARIAEIGLGGALTNEARTQCRIEVPFRGHADGSFAVVRYLGYRIELYRIVRLPSEPSLVKGDFVYINIRDCAQPAVPREVVRSSGSPSARREAVPGSHVQNLLFSSRETEMSCAAEKTGRDPHTAEADGIACEHVHRKMRAEQDAREPDAGEIHEQ